MATVRPQQAASLVVPQVARVLPGPAGKLQQLAAAGALQQATPELLGLKDHCNTHSTNTSISHDICFQSQAWRDANTYVQGSQEQLHTVKMAKDLSLGKVPKMLVVLGAVQPSGVNSAFCKVKDPTGIMGAALHQSVLQHQQYQQGRLGPGTVVLLHQVSVFTPAPGTSYLAVTASNIVKVWSGTSAHDRMRNPQPAQQQQQPQQMQQQAGGPHAQAATQRPFDTTSQLGSTSQSPGVPAKLPQQLVQVQQQQQQLQQGMQGNAALRAHTQQQPRASPSGAGSNRSSAFFPSSPDVTSLFKKPTEQQQIQQQQGQSNQQQARQQQLHQKHPLQSQHGMQQLHIGQNRESGQHVNKPPNATSQLQQQQEQLAQHGHGLMLPPAPRAPTTSFRAQLYKQQQQQQQQTQVQAPNSSNQHHLQRRTQPPVAAGIQMNTTGPKIIDDLLEELVALEGADAEDGMALGVAKATAAAAAPVVKPAGNGYGRTNNGSSVRALGGTISQQQHLQCDDAQLPRSDIQWVPTALIQQGHTLHTTSDSIQEGVPVRPVSGLAAMQGDGTEATDGVDDVVAAIFGSQMAPKAAAAAVARPMSHAAPSVAATSIFGRQMATSRPAELQTGKPSVNSQIQQRASGVLPRSKGEEEGSSTIEGGSNNGNFEIQRGLPQHDQKRLRISPAIGSGIAGAPLQPINGDPANQQQQQRQQCPVFQQTGQQQKTQTGWQVTQQRGTLSSSRPSVAVPHRPLIGLQGAGAASLLDDLLGDDLEDMDDL